MSRRRLPESFFSRDARDLAPDLIGRWLRRGEVILQITEVEAYLWPDDTACHACAGQTARNAAMFGPAGRAYVYLCYGLQIMLNVVSNAVGQGSAVLIRAARPIAGEAIVSARRGGRTGPVMLTGPGKVGAALDLDVSWSNHALFRAGGLELLRGDPACEVRTGPRIGIDYAAAKDRDAELRFTSMDTRWVSKPRKLGTSVIRIDRNKR